MPWFLVYTKPKQEQKAWENLANQGFDVVLPTARFEKLVRGARVVREEVLFPRYLFVALEQQSAVGAIRSTRGCVCLVQFGLQLPQPVPQTIIEELSCNRQHPIMHHIGPKTGDSVVIQQGPFCNLSAIFQEPDGTKRSFLLLELLGKPIIASFDNREFKLG